MVLRGADVRFWAGWADSLFFGTQSAVRFNTICVDCHEGECSGRLGFSLGPGAAYNHIRRYAGDVDDALARQLQALLVHMKRKCAYAPLPALDMHGPLKGEIRWDRGWGCASLPRSIHVEHRHFEWLTGAYADVGPDA